MVTVDNLEKLKIASNALDQIDQRIESTKSQHKASYFVDDNDDSISEKEIKRSKNISKNVEVTKTENITNNISLITSISVTVRIIGQDTGFDNQKIQDLILRIDEICKGNNKPELKKDAYDWAEQINIVKFGLQEIHTSLHKRQCTELLEYIATLYALIHRVAMRYLGFAYDIESQTK
jgi:hypothetical protein